MEGIVADSRYLVAAGGFLVAVIAAFIAGYVMGRGARSLQGAHATPLAPPGPGDLRPLPDMGGDEARLMDLHAIREVELEPPSPLDLGPPPRR